MVSICTHVCVGAGAERQPGVADIARVKMAGISKLDYSHSRRNEPGGLGSAYPAIKSTMYILETRSLYPSRELC